MSFKFALSLVAVLLGVGAVVVLVLFLSPSESVETASDFSVPEFMNRELPPMPVREPVVIYDAFYQIGVDDFCRSASKGLLAPRGLHPDILVVPYPPGFGGILVSAWTGGDYAIRYEKRVCSLIPEDNEEEDYQNPKLVTYWGLHGPEEEIDSFIPCNEIVISEKLKQALENSPFTGYELLPIDNIDDKQGGFLERVIYLVKFKGDAKDHEFFRWFYMAYPQYCETCGWGPAICPECERMSSPCPRCRSMSFRLVDQDPISEEEAWQTVQAPYPYYGSELTSGAGQVPCLAGEQWDGKDFLYSDWLFVSGRVAQWLVENRYGPVLLIPQPLDISRCTEEQLEAIEKIRYRKPSP